MIDLLGFDEWVNAKDLLKLLSRFFIDMFFATIIIKVIYEKIYKNSEYVFTYFVFNVVTFFLCFLLRKVPAELGFALAIFGVFSILRYRTETIRIVDLTFLFSVIGIAILNAVSNKKVSAAELVIVNGSIVMIIFWLQWKEFRPGSSLSEVGTNILYDRIDLLKVGSESLFRNDLISRFGIHANRFEIRQIDVLRDSALITIFHDRDETFRQLD